MELGLDEKDIPLAIKRIPKASPVCDTVKLLVDPLLNLRNKYILHYFAGNYEENELILCTPLCEYNMEEYLMLMKQTGKQSLSIKDIAWQFLMGLKYLHECKEPVIHGNLRPSNIFVDIKGVVRVAEFGIYKVRVHCRQSK